jgi:hypothetical protein
VIASLQNSCPNAPKGETMCPPLVHASHADPETWEAAGMLVAVCQLLMGSPVKKLAFAQDCDQIDRRNLKLAELANRLCSKEVRGFVRTSLLHVNAGNLPRKLDDCIEEARAAIGALLGSHQQQVTLLGTQVIRPRPLSQRQVTLPEGWEQDRNVGASFIRELSATPPPVSAELPVVAEARKRAMEKLSAIQRLPQRHDALSTSILLSIESMYSELLGATTDDARENCIRDAFPNQRHLATAMLALIEMLDPTIDVNEPVIKDADVDSLIKVVLFEERHRYEMQHRRPTPHYPPPPRAPLPRPAIPPRPTPTPAVASLPAPAHPKAPKLALLSAMAPTKYATLPGISPGVPPAPPVAGPPFTSPPFTSPPFTSPPFTSQPTAAPLVAALVAGVPPTGAPPPSSQPTLLPQPFQVPTTVSVPTLVPPSWRDFTTVVPGSIRYSAPPRSFTAPPAERIMRLLCGLGGLAQLLTFAVPVHDWIPWTLVISHVLLMVPASFLARALNRNVLAWTVITFFVPLAPVLLAFAPRRTG